MKQLLKWLMLMLSILLLVGEANATAESNLIYAEINGQVVDISNPIVSVSPGQTLTGRIDVQMRNDCSTCVIPSVGINSWERTYTDLGGISGNWQWHTKSYLFSFTAPNTAGDYYIAAGHGPCYAAADLVYGCYGLGDPRRGQPGGGDDLWDRWSATDWEASLPGGSKTDFRAIKIKVTISIPRTITVDDSGGADYTKIQDAIDNANPRDTIEVHSGTYYENVNVNKQLFLRGLDTDGGKPVIDAAGGSAITLTASRITLEGFIVTNSGDWPMAGIEVISSNNIIKDNIANNNGWSGINIRSGSNKITGNTVSNNGYLGISIYGSSDNIIENNNAISNKYGIYLSSTMDNIITNNNVINNWDTGIIILYAAYPPRFVMSNTIYNNNLVDNYHNAIDIGVGNQWDNGVIGNHYSNFDEPGEGCVDSDKNDICDSSYEIPVSGWYIPPDGYSGSVDRYPLVKWGVPTSLPELTVSDIKPIQVVYNSEINDDSKIDLVAGKATAVLDNIKLENSELLNGDATVDIRLYLNGKTIDTITKTINQLKSNGRVEFYFTPTDTGDFDIVVKVDPDDKIAESNENNNENKITVTVKDTNGLYLAYIPVDRPITLIGYRPLDMTKYSETVTNSGDFIRATYPIAGNEFINQQTSKKYYGDPIPCITVLQKEICAGITDDLISVWLWGELATSTKADRSVGIVPDNYFAYHNLAGTAGIMIPNILGVLVEEGYWTSTAHEIGHTYKLGLNPEEYILNPPGNSASGFWVDKQKDISNGICFMGFAGDKNSFDYSTNPWHPVWIDNEDYKHLFKEFRINKADPEVLLINGIIYKNNTVKLGDLYRLENGMIDNIIPGDYSIQVLDLNGQALSENNFDAPFLMYIDPVGAVETEISGFAFVIPYPENTAKVTLRYNNEILTEFNPNTKLLHDAIDLIPDYGFIKSPEQRRVALHNKVDEVEIKIKENNITDARNKLEFDIKDKLMKWLIDEYQKETPVQYSKDEIINLVDEIIYRLNLQI